MKTLIVEDEQPAAKRLVKLLEECCPACEVVDMLESVEQAAGWFRQNPSPDLVFMDIQLADGLSFDIFQQVPVKCPVIFTTAFDQYTLKAFKVNSVDYLLKPIDPAELAAAIEKYLEVYQTKSGFDTSNIERMLQSAFQQTSYKDRFLVRVGQNFIHLAVSQVAYFFSEDGLAFVQCLDGKKHVVDNTLDQLEAMLNPRDFFRINRQAIVRPDAIGKISPWFNSRLKLELSPPNETNNVVSRERVVLFKKWLGQ